VRLDHGRGALGERTAASYGYAISALLRQLLIEERLPAAWRSCGSQPIPPSDAARDSARLDALRARALVLTLYCSGVRREEATALETAEVLRGSHPGEADVRGKGDRVWTVFLDAAALEAIRAYINARGTGDMRKWVFVSHGNRRRRNDRLSPWSVWRIVKQLAKGR
jgi:site-specific recombinase XerD